MLVSVVCIFMYLLFFGKILLPWPEISLHISPITIYSFHDSFPNTLKKTEM